MTDRYHELIRQQSRPLEPIPTDTPPRLARLTEVRCVLFDVYGTLVVSGSGEVGTLLPDAVTGAFAAALAAGGIAGQVTEEEGRAALATAVAASHERDKAAGVEFPEVDIVEIWQACVTDLAAAERLFVATSDLTTIDFRRLAVEYEVRTNPVWPMPGAERCVTTLRERGLLIGMISNAQFFTPQILEALLTPAFLDLELSEDVQYYSYRHRQAKPGEALFRLAERDLADRGISPHEVLYVGNDMLNDIWPASKVGFRTALFAGDRRSLRLREDDVCVQGVKADVVVDQLESLLECVGDEQA